MTGLYYGIGEAIALSLVLLAYVPVMTVLLLSEIGMYRACKRIGIRLLFQALTLILLVVVIWLVFRSAPYVAIDPVLILGVAVTLVYLILRVGRIRRMK